MHNEIRLFGYFGDEMVPLGGDHLGGISGAEFGVGGGTESG